MNGNGASNPSAAQEGHGGRIPGLDGLRGLAAMGVVLLHSRELPGFPEPLWVQSMVGWLGGQSVPLFFVLSGYLITHLLLREEAKHGQISLKNFYARRGLRILPAALCYLAGLMALSHWMGLNVKWREIAASVFWYRNLLYGGWAAWEPKLLLDGAEAFTAHYWSLSVEEHFYMVWPALVVVMPSRFRSRLLLALVLILPIWRTANMKVDGIMGINYWRTDFVSDYLVLGALLAVLEGQWRAHPYWRRFWSSRWVLAVSLGLLLSLRILEWARPATGFLAKPLLFLGAVSGISLAAMGLVLLVGIAVHGRREWLDRFLNSRTLVWLGGISFSLYLWQQIFCDPGMRVVGWYFPFNAMAAIGVAAASHYLIERPFLRLRHQFR